MKKTRRIPFFKIIFGIVVLFLAVWILSGQKTWFSDEPPLQFLSDMDDQGKVKPQVGTPYFSNRAGDRDPLANTVPRNNSHYYSTPRVNFMPYYFGKTYFRTLQPPNIK